MLERLRPVGDSLVATTSSNERAIGSVVFARIAEMYLRMAEAVDYLLARIPLSNAVLCVSILRDKLVDSVLERLARAGDTLVATRSSNPRALPAAELAARARRFFARVEAVDDADAALARARSLAGPDREVLVTGSLYLLADVFTSD